MTPSHLFILALLPLAQSNQLLSRQRRYLVFPEGSSFQIVFDLTYPSVAIEGNVFMFGHTAAMAYELPSEPVHLSKKYHRQEATTTWNSVRRSVAHHIQRRSRRELYSKLETLLSALGKHRSCVLKAICQAHQLPNKGTMIQEIIKTVFKARHTQYQDEDQYDQAAYPNHNCDVMYANCPGYVLGHLFKNKK